MYYIIIIAYIYLAEAFVQSDLFHLHRNRSSMALEIVVAVKLFKCHIFHVVNTKN